MKFVLALITALVIPTAATASVADAFDNHNKPSDTFNHCYESPNKSLVCVQSLTDTPYIRTISIVDANAKSIYPTTIYVDCKNNHWEGYGATSNENMKLIAKTVCEF